MIRKNRPTADASFRIGIVLLLGIMATQAYAQQAPPPPPETPPGQAASSLPQQSQPTDKNDQEKRRAEQTGTSNDRLFYTLPNFLTVETPNVPPLTTRKKFKVVTREAFDYITIPWYGFLAGVSQAQNSEPGYGQGAAGYGKRFGAAFADGTIESYLTGAILPSMLHQDPRYYQLGQRGFWYRTGYAMSRIPVTRTDSARKQFNYSEIVGSGVSAVISTYSYHPSADRNLPNACKIWAR